MPGRVQRAPITSTPAAPAGSSAESRPRGSRAAQIEGPVRVHRGAEAAELAGALSARAFTHDGEIFLPASHGPLSGQNARSLLAHEMTHVAQQRLLGTSLPGEETAHGRDLETQATAAERGQPLPLVIPAAAPAGEGHIEAAAQPPSLASEAATVQLATTESSGAPQRAPLNSLVAANGRGAAPGTRPDDEELDDLAQRLYARIDRRLRRDLLDERERSGTLVDLH